MAKEGAPSPLEAASLWIRKRRDARFGLEREQVIQILEKITAEHGSVRSAPSVAVIVAHPDDEAIGAAAILRGVPNASVVHVTDGAPNDDEYARRKGFETREMYARARRQEVVAALSVIGVPEARIRGLGFVDGEIPWHLVEVCNAIAEVLLELRPDIVLTHPYEGGHSDHDSTAFAVQMAVGLLRRDGVPAPVILELTSYHNHNGVRRLFDFLPFRGSVIKTVRLTEEDRAIKRRVFEEFKSQAPLLRTIPIELERFRQAPRYLFTVPPHEGQLDYERLCRRMTGAEWRLRAEEALQALRSKRVFAGMSLDSSSTGTDAPQ